MQATPELSLGGCARTLGEQDLRAARPSKAQFLALAPTSNIVRTKGEKVRVPRYPRLSNDGDTGQARKPSSECHLKCIWHKKAFSMGRSIPGVMSLGTLYCGCTAARPRDDHNAPRYMMSILKSSRTLVSFCTSPQNTSGDM